MSNEEDSEIAKLFEQAISREKIEISVDAIANLVLALKEQQIINEILMTSVMRVALGDFDISDIDKFSIRNDTFLEYEQNLVRALAKAVKA